MKKFFEEVDIDIIHFDESEVILWNSGGGEGDDELIDDDEI